MLPILNDQQFKDRFRVSRKGFNYLVKKVGPIIKKNDTNFRKAIPVEKRIHIALNYLGCLAEHRVIKDLFGVGTSTAHEITLEFSSAIIDSLEKELIPFPYSVEALKAKAQEFEIMRNLPQCVGAIDGCHLTFCPPKKEAQDYHCFKGFYSMVLFAAVDARYRFFLLMLVHLEKIMIQNCLEILLPCGI